MPTKLVVGLGNPGKDYAATRHNVGFRVIDSLHDEKWDDADLFKPAVYMNASGGPVAAYARQNGIAPQDILVICDDFMLPLGSLRLRLKGSSGGHNGLDSILKTLGTLEIPRLRLGVGPVPAQQDPADFVLMAFKKSERDAVETMVERAAQAVRTIAAEGFEKAMNQFNLTTPHPNPLPHGERGK
jgi:PTH1 family peptidyl-tRNA hydrolase